MHKKIIFIIILLASLSFVSASYEVKDIELSNREIKEISDTHNEVSYNFTITIENHPIYYWGINTVELFFHDDKGSYFERNYVYNESKYQCPNNYYVWYNYNNSLFKGYDNYTGYIKGKTTFKYNKNETIPLPTKARVVLIREPVENVEKTDQIITEKIVSVFY